jgi:hypothetical protein
MIIPTHHRITANAYISISKLNNFVRANAYTNNKKNITRSLPHFLRSPKQTESECTRVHVCVVDWHIAYNILNIFDTLKGKTAHFSVGKPGCRYNDGVMMLGPLKFSHSAYVFIWQNDNCLHVTAYIFLIPELTKFLFFANLRVFTDKFMGKFMHSRRITEFLCGSLNFEVDEMASNLKTFLAVKTNFFVKIEVVNFN